MYLLLTFCLMVYLNNTLNNNLLISKEKYVYNDIINFLNGSVISLLIAIILFQFINDCLSFCEISLFSCL